MKKQIEYFIWPQDIIEKCIQKHGVYPGEVESVFQRSPKFYFREKADVDDEDLYQCLGRTEEGRYLCVFYIDKKHGEILIISARDMDAKEKRKYGKK